MRYIRASRTRRRVYAARFFFPSIALGIFGLFYLTDRVQDARWLPDDEKSCLASELAKEAGERAAAGRVSAFAAFRQPQTT